LRQQAISHFFQVMKCKSLTITYARRSFRLTFRRRDSLIVLISLTG
jgi:hypothetical protein